MTQKKQKSTLEQQLYRSFFFVSSLVILLSLGITLYYDITRQGRDMDAVISGTASYIASMPNVISMLESGYPNPLAKQDIDSLCNNIPDISVVVIYDKNGLRFYHTDRQKTGESFVNGEEIPILSGSDPYITIGYGTKGSQRRAFHAVRSQDGGIIGYVMASVFTNHISDRHRNIILVHGAILAGMLFISLSLVHATLKFLRKSLMGFHPNELLTMYLKQDEVLNAVEEGLIASSPDGTILFSNLVARRLFTSEQKPLMGQSIKDIFPKTKIDNVIKTGSSEYSQSCVINGHTVLANEIPIRTKSKSPVQGVLTILFDQTEMLRITDELSGTQSMLDTLRAFNHEFLNKLHVILGYLQTGDTGKAMEFIVNSSLVTSQSIGQTADCLRVSQICALVIGKMMHAAELGILLTIAPDSCCMERDLLLPMDDYITILGNLMENAIEELNTKELEIREIKLSLYFSPECNIIICEDTGNGIPDQLIPHILLKGVSQKGENRGYGLYLIHQIVEENGGEMTIETESGEGTCFTLTFTRKDA